MTCEELARRIDDYLDDELDAPIAAELRAHLDDCPHCRAQFGPLVSAVEALQQLPELCAPDGLVEGAMARIPERESLSGGTVWALGIAGAAATALIALVGLWAAQGIALGGHELVRAALGVPGALASAGGGWLHLGLKVAEVAGGALAQPVALGLVVYVALVIATTAAVLSWRRLVPATTRLMA
jgi:anti-sigma factor RsiW